VLLFNHGEAEYQVKEGERVAQLVLERVGLSVFHLFLSFNPFIHPGIGFSRLYKGGGAHGSCLTWGSRAVLAVSVVLIVVGGGDRSIRRRL
jgi:dUTPase